MRTFPMLLAAALAMAAPAWAQSGAPQRVVGTVDGLDGQTLTVRQPNGTDQAVEIPPGTRIGALVNRKLSDIKPGDFVGSAAVRGRDGKLHAQEVHIFPEALRGSGEGSRPMNGLDRSMTNATVDGIAGTPDGQMLTLRYPGGEQQIDVGPDARIVGLVAGDMSLLKPGSAVVVNAAPGPDGKLTARSIQAEKDGVMPLM